MTTLPPWRHALERLLSAPALSGPQARFLFESLGVPRDEALDVLLERLADPVPARARDAAILFELVASGADKPRVTSFMECNAPLAVRVQARSLYQNGILHGRLSDEEADLPPPAALLLDFHVEEAARHVGRVPSPLQRARIAAETMVGDVAIPDDCAPSLVPRLASRLDVDPAQIWAELRIHPLTRPTFRAAAEDALKAPSQAAANLFEQAAEQLLPGELQDIANGEATRHRAAPAAPWQARVSVADARGTFAALLWTDGPEPSAFAGVFSADVAASAAGGATGAGVEAVLAYGFKEGTERGGMRTVSPEQALGLIKAGAPWLQNPPKKPTATVATALEWFGRIEKALGAPAAPATLPAPGTFDVKTTEHALLGDVEVLTTDLSDANRKTLGKEMRLFGKVRDEAAVEIATDLAKKSAVTGRFVRALEHTARLAQVVGDEAAPAISALATARPNDANGKALLTALLRKAIASVPPQGPPQTSRDDLRDDLLPPEPLGQHVLALDLGAAALDGAISTPKALDGIRDSLVFELHAEAGRRAAAAVLAGGPNEDVRLQEAAKEAIRDLASSLPSRQRRELGDVWLKAWNELLTNACRGTCTQQCPAHPDAPRPFGAYALDHPRLNKPWPS